MCNLSNAYCAPPIYFFFLATNEHKFSLTKGRASQIPFGLYLPRMALVPIGAIDLRDLRFVAKKIIVSGFPKYCLWTTEGRARQLLYYCHNLCMHCPRRRVKSSVVSFLKLYLCQLLYYCQKLLVTFFKLCY